MNTLTDYYKSTGGTLGKTVQDRFADPNFAKAAEMAGFNSTNYTINANNADANNKILSNLKVLQASGGLQSSNTGAVQTTGNQATKDASVVNNVNGWLNGQSGTTGATTGNPTATGNGNTNPSGKVDTNSSDYQTGPDGVKRFKNPQTGNYDVTEAGQNAPKIQRSSTDPLQQSFYDVVDQQNAFAAEQINTLYTQLEPARARLNAANQAIVDRIKQNFDQARAAQEKVTANILAGTEKAGNISGRSRYASETQQGIMANEIQNGIDRITALNVQEADLIAKAEQARSEDDFNMLYKTWTEYNNIRSETNKVVADLYKQSVQADKNAKDAQLEEIKAKKQSITDQLKVIDSVAPSIAEQLARMPENLKEPFLQQVAQKYGVDVNQIKGSVITYQNERSDKKKTAASGGTGGTVSERNAYKEGQAYNSVEELLAEDNFAFEVSGKEPVQLKDDNGYITPQGFRLLNARLLRDGGVDRVEFIKQYPELFYIPLIDNYGLTQEEKKILTKVE